MLSKTNKPHNCVDSFPCHIYLTPKNQEKTEMAIRKKKIGTSAMFQCVLATCAHAQRNHSLEIFLVYLALPTIDRQTTQFITFHTMQHPYTPKNMPQPGGGPGPIHQGGAAPTPGSMSGGPPGGAGKDDSYFTESRKGEVNELRQLLRTFGTERDKQRKREIIKKVIAYMTLGIDVSRLFTEMMLAIETRDLVIKKMVYLFLCNYAETHPDLAQMCTNTLVKDSGNEDPMVRGLALRALCSLRLPQMIEYTSEPLRRSLQDGHAYVRKTGVMGILKMYHLNKEDFDKAAFNDILYDMLRDPDSSVVTNCILVLNEIMADSGGMALNRAVMLHLLNRIHEFSEFGILSILDLVPRYIPANDEGKRCSVIVVAFLMTFFYGDLTLRTAHLKRGFKS